MNTHATVPFGQLAFGALFMRNGMKWRKEAFPSGCNARYMGTDELYFAIQLRDFQEVRPL